ncbi:MAG: hypothetical protein M1294_11120 [Firmicutes bacterium]|nr:hypothetical protein [Bacillota bacterium]
MLHRSLFDVDDSQQEAHNPNVVLETGFTLGLNKPVCVLKHKNVRKMSDLIGDLHKGIDDTDDSILDGLNKWVKEVRLSAQR